MKKFLPLCVTIATTSVMADAIQIPTTKYVRDYLSTAGKLPNLTLNNVGSFQIPTEKYVMSAIDHVNAENGNETHYADDASSDIPMDLSYFLAQTTEKLDTCPVPPWGDDKAPQTMSYVDADVTVGKSRWPSGMDTQGVPVYNDKYGTWVLGGNMYSYAARHFTYYMMYSTDGGITWNQSNWPSDISNGYNNIVYNEQHGTMVQGGGRGVPSYMMYSTDGGKTWEQSDWPADIYNHYYQCVYNAKYGTMVSGGNGDYTYYMMYSTDGGITWNQSNWPSDMWAGTTVYNEKTGTLLTVSKGVMYSMDGGKTWTKSSTWNPNWGANKIVYNNNAFMALVNDAEEFVVSNDDGATWNISPLPDWTYGPWGIEENMRVFSNNIIIFRDFTGVQITYSYDGGKTWHMGDTPFSGEFIKMLYHNGVICMLNILDSGSDCLFAYSANFGKSWTCVQELNSYVDGNNSLTLVGDKFILSGYQSGRGFEITIDIISDVNPWAVGGTCDATKTTIDDMCTDPLVGGTATCVDAKCSCTRQKLIDKSGAFVDNVAQTPVVINHTFDTQNECNALCANICADNAVNNTDGAQKAILCGK